MLLILFLSFLGAYHLWIVLLRKRCDCALDQGIYTIQEEIGVGGFADVFLVLRDGDEFVLKKVLVNDIDEANDAQTEAKELRKLQHPFIIKVIILFYFIFYFFIFYLYSIMMISYM